LEKFAIAKALLKQNVDIDVIVKSTGLSKKDVQKLRLTDNQVPH